MRSGENSTVEHDCEGKLDPEVWPADLSAAIAATTWGVTITNRCAVEGCAGTDDPMWGEDDGSSEPEECDLSEDNCPSAFIGAAFYFGGIGSLEGPAGEAMAVAVSVPVDAAFHAGDSGAGTFTEWIDVLTTLAGPPPALYNAFGEVWEAWAQALTGSP